MLRYRVFLASAFAVFLVSACATLDEDACRAGDWEAIGFSDGADGRGPDHIYAHARACNDYGVAPVRAPWEDGRQQGLAVYCTPERAWREGSRGSHLRPVCPAADRAFLLRANERGLRYHQIGLDIAQAERRINEINGLLNRMSGTAPGRSALVAERSILRLELLQLRLARERYVF